MPYIPYGPLHLQTPEERALGIPAKVKGYGCVRCQTQHFEGDEMYQPHIGWQSKHGIQDYSASMVADARARRSG